MINSSESGAFVTPKELSGELGVSERAIRRWLRGVEMRPAGERWTRWRLSPEEAAFVRKEFKS
jgi:predicted site-specific integrase-resolvase